MLRILLTLVALLALVLPAHAQLPAWEELPNTALVSVLPSPLPPGGYGGSAGIVGAWNQPAVDTKRGCWVFAAAGGHADYSGNEIYRYCFPNGPWQRLRNPSATADMVPFHGKTSDGSTTNQAKWCLENAHPCNANRDGTPVSVHTYGGIVYLPDQDAIWLMGGSRWWDGKGHKWGWWLTNLDASPPTWLRRLDGTSGGLGQVGVWDTIAKRLHLRTETAIYSYNPALDTAPRDPISVTAGVWPPGSGVMGTPDGTWKRRSLGDSGTGNGKTMVVDPTGQRAIRVGHSFR